MLNKSINFKLLNEEMFYEPSWYIDQVLFYELLNKSTLTSRQYLEIARLHVKYKHVLHRPETKRCFNYLVSKTKCLNVNELYIKTRTLYRN